MLIRGYDTEEIEQSMKSFDWSQAFYDPMYAMIEADTPEDKEDAMRMEQLIEGLQVVYAYSDEGRQYVQKLLDKHWKGQPMEQQLDHLFGGLPSPEQRLSLVYSGLWPVIEKAIAERHYWAAYNTEPIMLMDNDVRFFRDADSANAFAKHYSNDLDRFKVIEVRTSLDFVLKACYGLAAQQTTAVNQHPTLRQQKPTHENSDTTEPIETAKPGRRKRQSLR